MRIFLVLSLASMLAAVSPLCAQTTMEEFNYVTSGYKMQLAGGLDMKKGYRFEDLFSHDTRSASTGDVRTTQFKALFREGQQRPCAVMCILSNTSQTSKEYLCIPSYSSEPDVWNLAMKRILEFSEEDLTTITVGFAILASYYSGK